MAIAKRPSAPKATAASPEERERKIDAFINGNGAGLPPETPELKKKPTPVRFDPEMYPRIDAAAKRRGLSRAAWVRLVVSQALEAEDGNTRISF